nr:RNA polymerase sigma-70 factor [uncultured Carboxylicivirga sp.]
MLKTISESIKLESIAEGNESEFEKLFITYHAKLHRFAYLFVHSKELADEIVMDVFYNLWNKRKNLPSVKNLETYLFISVRNLSYTAVKREGRYKFDDLDALEVDIPKYHITPESNLISNENIEEINLAIETLPSKCKMVFKLIREEGFSKKEVSDILNISVKTIDNQISIAVRKIAEVLNVSLESKNYSSYIQTFLFLM